MTLGELIAAARIRLDDRVPEYLWSTADLTEFANAAQEEACDRARLLRDNVPVTVVDGTSSYLLTEIPLHITDIRFTDADGKLTVLAPYSYSEFNTATFFGNVVGTPQYYEIGESPNQINLFPTPNLNGTLSVDICRLPNEDERMVGDGDEPVIPAEFHRDLVHWMVFEAFSLRDADTRETASADRAEQRFERRFGPKISAKHKAAARRSITGKDMYPRRFGG